MANKLFGKTFIPDNHLVSKVRCNREYLISQDISRDLNTYNYFGIFASFNDVHKRQFSKGSNEYNKRIATKDAKGNTVENYGKMTADAVKEVFDPTKKTGSPSVRSIFNRAGGMMLGTDGLPAAVSEVDINKHIRNGASGWRISNNVPLMDSPNTRERIRRDSGCSVKELVQQSEQGLLGRAIYSYADFMYCKYLGKVPNNYLITLRRFPVPPGDFISTVSTGKVKLKEGSNMGGQQIGCMVTWLGTPGNEMGNILKYSYKMPYEDKKSDWQTIEGSADGASGVANSIAAAFDPAYRAQYISGHGGGAFNAHIGKFFGCKDGPYNPAMNEGFYDQNKVYGPIDKVKSTMMRSSEGLEFEQNITLTFYYELRAYNGINTRQAMLDLLSNILQVTYTSGGFWGGGYRGGGMHQNSIFNNLAIFKCHGGFDEFMDAFSKDYSTVTEKISGSVDANGGWLNTIKKALNQLGGMILGGLLNRMGRPQRMYANSLLSEQPVGLWHIMVGNPNHPILSIGNMVLLNTEVEHYGPLGLDDFPSGLKVTCTLKRGKPRDLREIEKMYMHGNDRIFFSMGPKVTNMYKQALDYKKKENSILQPASSLNDNIMNIKKGYKDTIDAEDKLVADKDTMDFAKTSTETREITAEAEKIANELTPAGVDAEKMGRFGDSLQKWFGETDVYSIYFAAAEQEYGATKSKGKN